MSATVGTRELKTRLGRYLRLVKGGATIVVTDRGRPVAELRPIAKAEDDEEALLQELAALGKVRLPSGTPFPPFRPIRLPGPSVSQALSQAIREDRDAGY